MDKNISVEYSHEDLEKVYFNVSYNVRRPFDEVYRTNERIITYQKDFNHETNEFSYYSSSQNPKYTQGALDYQSKILREINRCFCDFKNGYIKSVEQERESILIASNFWEKEYRREKAKKWYQKLFNSK